jgi:hypothetical protein
LFQKASSSHAHTAVENTNVFTNERARLPEVQGQLGDRSESGGYEAQRQRAA